jgi:hypothetical protein
MTVESEIIEDAVQKTLESRLNSTSTQSKVETSIQETAQAHEILDSDSTKQTSTPTKINAIPTATKVPTFTHIIPNHDLDPGFIGVFIYLTMENTGDTVAEYGENHFYLFDVNGVSHDSEYIDDECELDYSVEVLPDGIYEGCISYELKDEGNFSLLYAPYKVNQFGIGRFVSWDITYESPDNTVTNSVHDVTVVTSDEQSDFSSMNIYLYSSNLLGEAQYIGVDPISIEQLDIHYFDKNEYLLDTSEGTNWQDVIYPGDKIIFWSSPSSRTLDTSTFEVSIKTNPVDSYRLARYYRDFQIDNFSLISTDSQWLKMSGKVKNIGDSDVMGVGVHVIAYDSQGNIIGYNMGTAGYELDIFEPNMMSPIKGSMMIESPGGVSSIDHFEFILEAFIY